MSPLMRLATCPLLEAATAAVLLVPSTLLAQDPEEVSVARYARSAQRESGGVRSSQACWSAPRKTSGLCAPDTP